MSKSKQDAIERLKRDAAKFLDVAHLIETIIPDLPDYAEVWGTERAIRVDIPYNRKHLNQIRALLGSNWRFCHSFLSLENGWRINTYIHKPSSAELVVTMSTHQIGATCQRIQVGVEEKPVYQIVCN